MSALNNAAVLLLGAEAAAGGYNIERSLRFNSSDSAYLSRTPSTAGNRKTWTLSFWLKKTAPGGSDGNGYFSSATSPGSTNPMFVFRDPGDQFDILNNNSGGTTNLRLTTTAVYRDYSAWMHVVLALDTTQATAANRARLYINGTEVTTFSTATYPAQNTDLDANGAIVHNIGREAARSNYYSNYYLANVEFVDGSQFTPSSFAETDATTGQWVPKLYTGSYGTNGFKLTFADNSTAAALGTDTSGNSNNWTVNNISVAAGSGNDSLVDTPTNYGTDTGAGGEVRGNYATLNPLTGGTGSAPSNGNLDFAASDQRYGTIGITSGKWYWEVALSAIANSGSQLGISNKPQETVAAVTGLRSYSSSGNKYDGSTNTTSAYGASYTTGDIIGVAFDRDAGTLTFYKNGVSQGQAFSGLTADTWFPLCRTDAGTTGSFNFGQRPFAYPAPSGFKALCTQNLPDPVVAQPSTVMDVKLYTGNGSTQTISGLGFSPDLVWTKSRSSGLLGHRLQDVVRGATKEVYSNATNAEYTNTNSLTSFNSDGFSIGSENGINQSGETFVAWTWDAGTTTVTNTQGSITSQVRANPSAGFSIVSFSGTINTVQTVGHGLSVVPQFIIFKNRTDGTQYWTVYHASLGNTKGLVLNGTDAAVTYSGYFDNTTPTSTVFTVGAPSGVTNGASMIAYCFAPVAGYSSFGSYIGNGDTSGNGPFVFTGHLSRWLMIKRTDTAADWILFDTARDTYNQSGKGLRPNLSDSEYDDSGGIGTGYTSLDFLSNGFKVRGASGRINASGGTYLYASFAQNPFKTARAR